MTSRELTVAFAAGALGTIAMSIPMLVATVVGAAPMPRPIPIAIVAGLLGSDMPKPVLVLLGGVSHLVYGGVWAALLTAAVERVTVWKGLALGVFLWLLMQLVVLPALGWGVFGSAITPKIAVATLVLHLIYGATTGYLLRRLLGNARSAQRSAERAARM